MKKTLQGLILAAGLMGATFAYVTTPEIYVQEFDLFLSDAPTALARGGGVLVLTVVAFGGVTIMFKDD
ncbi:uncharacterized protein METZ01_LOCUS203608 [marine metagenome]|jgi:hypothetical protein|uniref:Uncharacterized protein n=1 Tax=marine metagenome TaxID=408172 RepID=A0A382EKY3_9ZZZZ